MKPVMRKLKSSRQQLGQGMTEYIVIVALIAVAAIAVYQLFGATIRNQTAGIALEVSGKNGSTAITKAGDAATKAETAAKDTAKNSLSTYGDQATTGTQN
ncbi:pilus assembly protein [Duganella dendranthematis]|uniref:Pilus assembly protein n=2 Tax=Duganella dendranthematis TaxID=2728021 RepID=A0ABX6MEV7_9BURK|nr:pilus assembly protein [Duganella dendranthematis]